MAGTEVALFEFVFAWPLTCFYLLWKENDRGHTELKKAS